MLDVLHAPSQIKLHITSLTEENIHTRDPGSPLLGFGEFGGVGKRVIKVLSYYGLRRVAVTPVNFSHVCMGA